MRRKEDAWEVIVVEDNGKDKTREIARAMAADFPGKIKVLERPGKMGLGSAYKDALTKCDSEGKPWCSADLVFIMDADLSHHVSVEPSSPVSAGWPSLAHQLSTHSIALHCTALCAEPRFHGHYICPA